MAYSELIKNFELIRDYMRQFYVYGFKSRNEYDAKSARSYDNERRRIESWMNGYMSFRHTEDGKNVFISVDSRTVSVNPLYNAFKAKSFTSGDIMLHFYILDILAGGRKCSVREIADTISGEYLACFENTDEIDESSVRKKLAEYVNTGILKSEKQGRKLLYSRNENVIGRAMWKDAAAFFSEAEPLGVIGSFILDKYEDITCCFNFKHHYILDALNAQIIEKLAEAIDGKRGVDITVKTARLKDGKEFKVCPMKIFISTQSGRQHLLCYQYTSGKPAFFRIDNIHGVKIGGIDPKHEIYDGCYTRFSENLWGVSAGEAFSIDHVELVIHYEAYEKHIPQRLEREKRRGTVAFPDENTCMFTADVYDATEMIPWIRTFIGRIVSFRCSNKVVEENFYKDLDEMSAMYGGDESDIR